MLKDTLKNEIIPLMAENTRLVRDNFRRRAQHLGLTQPQWRILIFISKEPGIKLATLAEKLEVHPVTATQSIDRMVKAGWIHRERQESDRRTCGLFLTEQSEPIMDELNMIARETNVAALGNFKASEKKQLECLLQKIKQNLNEAVTSQGSSN